jgi:hypothetical protein
MEKNSCPNRYIFTLFLSLLLSINHSYGQSHVEIPIPVLKESKVIDSLMDVILNPNTKPNVWDGSKALQDSCIIISMIKENDSSFLFHISTTTKKNVNYSINFLAKKQTDFGYFQYKGTNVFVREFDHFNIFFAGTLNFGSLEFIYKLKENYHELPDGLLPRGSKTWSFEYKDGHFSQWYIKAAY